jgi:hypothetical protein
LRHAGRLGRLASNAWLGLLTAFAAGSALSAAEEAVSEQEAKQRLERSAENRERWLGLEWSSHVELRIEGELRQTLKQVVRYQPTGDFHRSLAGASAEGVRGGGPVLRSRKARKQAEALERIERLQALVDAYFRVSPGEALEFLERATVVDDASGETGSRKVIGRGYAFPHDEVELLVEPETGFVRAVRASNRLEGQPLTLEMDFLLLEDGTNVPHLAHVTFAAERAVMTVRYHDHRPRPLP